MSFESLTDAKIDALLRMEKRVTNPTKRTVQDANHFKCDYQVASAGDAERFVLFVRQNKTLTDDFSCGLQWLPPGSPALILVRYNGPSHAHPNRLEGDRIEFVPHIHRTTERYLRANLKPARGKIFEHLLAESGVRDEGGQLMLDATLDTLGTRILQFGQTITRIYDLTFLNRSRVAGTFYDDLQEMLRRLVGEDRLKENYVIPDQPNADDYPIDYRIEAKGPQRFLFGIASRDKARLATIIIEHWLRHGVDFDSLLIFADQQEIPRADLARLSNAGGEMVASLDAAEDLQRKLLRRIAA